MGRETFTTDSYRVARQNYGVSSDRDVTRNAERKARESGHLSEIVDPAINPIRRSLIRLNPHGGKWIATLGCPMDIEVTCDTTGSMGGEVDTEMAVLPDLYASVAKVLPGYDPQLCLGIFGDCEDDFVMCRPQFEMEAPKIVKYLQEMAPQRCGAGNGGEDPQYAMFARAYLTDAYTNRIGLKGYHFVVTDEPYHDHLRDSEIRRIFGEEIFNNELKRMNRELPTVKAMTKELKKKTHQFVLVRRSYWHTDEALESWRNLCGRKSVICIESTEQLPEVISAIIGLTEGTLDVTDLRKHLQTRDELLIEQLSEIDIGAQAKLRHAMPHPVPKAGDIYTNKTDTWPIQPGEVDSADGTEDTDDNRITYL